MVVKLQNVTLDCIDKTQVLETILPHSIKKIYKLNKDVPFVFVTRGMNTKMLILYVYRELEVIGK